jgi:glycosyltransferase involved in cell wall biosynthesis
MSSDTPRLALVIATYRRPDALATALRSVRAQTLDPQLFEVIVVVDGVDETERDYREVLKAASSDGLPLDYLFQQNAGQSVARHRGILRASAPWICIVDDDMELVPGFLAAHLSALEAGGDKTVVFGRVIPEDDWESAPLYEAVRTRHMLEWHAALDRGDFRSWGIALVTQNVAFGRRLYLAVGGFDENLRLGEDTELGLQFEFAGASCAFASDAAAVHRSRVGSYETWLRRCVEYGRYAVYIYEKLGRDMRAHPMQVFVDGSRLNTLVVRAVCWSDPLARGAIACLHQTGRALQHVGVPWAAIATHKAIQALAYHIGVKRALGSWSRVLHSARELRVARAAALDPAAER